MKYILYSLIFLATTAQAGFIQNEESSHKIQTELLNVSSINGLLVGYAFYCQQPEDNIKLMNSYFNNMISHINDEDIKKEMQSNYEDKVKTARDKGPTFSGTDCTK